MKSRRLKSPLIRLFASRLRSEREKKGYSQESLAERANLHRTYVGAVERGERNISLLNVEKLAKALGTTACDLICRPDSRT